MIPILAQNGRPQAIPIAGQTPQAPGNWNRNQSPETLQPHDTSGGISLSQNRVSSADLHRFFQNKPPLIDKGEGHTESTGTRDATFFDMHLHKDLRLKRVVFRDDLLANLSKFCDELVQNSSEFPLATNLSFTCTYPENPRTIDEATLQAHCTAVSSRYLNVATGLRFKTSWDAPVFKIAASPADIRRKFAAADGYLFPDSQQNSLSEDQELDFKLLETYGLGHFVIWEYKSLACGLTMFENLREMVEGDFTWITCQERSSDDECSTSCHSNSEKHRCQGRLKITGRRTGPDSRIIENFLQSTSDLEPQPTGSKRPLDNHNDSGRPSKHRRVSTKTPNDKPRSKKTRQTRLIVQQTWAEAVAEDATFLIISAGNHEYLGIRHRETQTLYLSRLIKPNEDTAPAHAKFQIATFIAAFDDALDRARQMRAITASKTLPQDFPSRFLLQLDEVPEASNMLETLVPKDKAPISMPLSKWNDETILARLTSSNCSIHLRHHGKKPEIASKPPPTWTLDRISTGVINTPEDSDITLFLDHEDSLPSSGRVFRVFLGLLDGTPTGPHYYSKPLVLKIAIAPQDKQRLTQEFVNYQLLHSETVGSVVKQYGHYSCKVKNGVDYHFLLLEDGGPSLISRGAQLNRHLEANRDAYRTALDSFHQKGFIHENLSSEHILMYTDRTDGALASLISLAGCTRPAEDLESASSNDVECMKGILGTL